MRLWAEKSGLAKIDKVLHVLKENKINGQRLLTLTEAELLSQDFGIESLGKRKKIIRAINFLKAKTCRTMGNGISALLP